MANATTTDPLESLTTKLINHSTRECVGFIEPWELRSVLNELRAAREAVKRTVKHDEPSYAEESWNDALNMVAEMMEAARTNPLTRPSS